MTGTAIFYSTETVFIDDVIEGVALASEWVPQLETTVGIILLAHHEDHFAIGHAITEDNIRLVLLALLLVYIAEVVG